jgi:hypothetical protein
LSTNVIQPSFAAGELSPQLFGRVDLAKYKTGLALAYNFFVDYRGGISNRPGTQYLANAASNGNVRLVPFQFNNQQTYMLEFGNGYMRVIKDGGYVLEAGKAVVGLDATSQVFTVASHGYSTGDMVYVDGVGGSDRFNKQIWRVLGIDPDHFKLRLQRDAPPNAARFGAWTGGGLVSRLYKISTPYTENDLPGLRWTQSADTMTLTVEGVPPYDLTRTGHAAWTFTRVNFGAAVTSPGAPTGSPSSAGSMIYSYVVTAVDAAGNESLPSPQGIVSGSVNMSATAGVITLTWGLIAGADHYNIYKGQASIGTSPPNGSQHGYVGTSHAPLFVDSNITPDFAITPPLHQQPFAYKGIARVDVTAGGSGVPATATLSVTDAFGGTGAVLVPVISAGTVTSVLVLSGGEAYGAPVVSISGGSGVVLTPVLGPDAGMYPSTVGYFQQRKVYANTPNSPQQFWMSRPGLFKNFDTSMPASEQDAITGVLASLQVNDIRWMVPMTTGLIMLTGGGAWQISGGSSGSPLTPRSITAAPQAYSGIAGNLPPLVVNFDILYVQALGSVVRDLTYNFFANVYTGNDITVMANHLFYNHFLSSWTYAEEPNKLVWVVREDGKLLSMTFLKEQDIYGWCQHSTDYGYFKEVATVVEGNENAVYFVVSRPQPGGGFNNYVERLATRKFTQVQDAWFVDSGVQYKGTPTAGVVNLDHLEGQTVAILADGNVLTRQIVTNGVITFPHPASTVTVGMPYQSLFQTLPLDTGEPTIQGKRKKVSAVTVKVDRSRGLQLGRSLTTLRPIKERTDQPYGTPPPLVSKDERMVLESGWDATGQIHGMQEDPLPTTILAVVPEISVGDTGK